MYPPELTAKAQRDARYHLQLRITKVSIGDKTATASGDVVRVFRGPKEMLGQAVTTLLPCIHPGDARSPTGDSPFPTDQLREGRILEAYFSDSEMGLSVQAGLSMLANTASDAPRIKLINARPPRWWQRSPLVIGIVFAAL